MTVPDPTPSDPRLPRPAEADRPSTGFEPSLPGTMDEARVLREIATALKAPDAGTRLWPSVEPTLLRMLGHEDRGIRDTAGSLLCFAMLPSESAAEEAARLLSERTDEAPAFRMLWSMGPAGRAALPALARLIADTRKDRDLRHSAAQFVEIYPVARAAQTEPALGLLREEFGTRPRDQESIRRISRLAARLGPAASEFIPALLEGAEFGPTAVLVAVLRIGPTAECARLAESRLGAGQMLTRLFAAATLLRISPGHAAASAALRAGLRTDPWDSLMTHEVHIATTDVRPRSVATILASVGPDAVPFLVDAVRGDNGALGCQSAVILGGLGPAAEPAVRQLERKAESGGRVMRIVASAALLRLAREPSVRALAVQESYAQLNTDERVAVIAWLKGLPCIDPAVSGVFASALRDPRSLVRRAAAQAVAGFPKVPEDLRPTLTTALDDFECTVRRAAALSLWRLDNEAGT
jgi:hypothetical protein